MSRVTRKSYHLRNITRFRRTKDIIIPVSSDPPQASNEQKWVIFATQSNPSMKVGVQGYTKLLPNDSNSMTKSEVMINRFRRNVAARTYIRRGYSTTMAENGCRNRTMEALPKEELDLFRYF
ncbi:hypothetical protein PIB30_017590 [Stylosanthes scabra]|uniref:Uncharacterized protein n=1 Tax=Stylosanthes scabra TaxID=79078 RepID=A0ABU6UAB5_9FABA|nr:hypothetical protein [Stylosanthes scabra]